MGKPSLLAVAITASVFLSAPVAIAAEPTSQQQVAEYDLSIQAGPLNQALLRLASTSGISFSADASILQGKQSPGVTGTYSVSEAFDALLQGTGLTAEQTPDGYVLRPQNTTEAGNSDEQPLSLDKVVVTAAGFEQELVDAPASISVITRDDIEKRYYSDVTDALRNIPGVTITGGGSGDGGTDISMRGLPSSYTLLLVDGKRQDSRESRPNGSAGFEQDWLPPMAAVERIEVVRGPMSTLYGSDAIGGVINIITRKVPQEWHGSVTLDTVLQENRDAGDIRQANIFAGGPLIEDTLGLQVFGRTYKREEDDIVNGYEEKKLNSASAKLSYTPSLDHDLILEAGMTKQERHATLGRSNPTEDCGRSGCGDSESKHERKYYNLAHIGRWGFANSDSYIQTEKTRNDGRDMEITNTVANTNWVMSFDSNILSVGAQYQTEKLEDSTSNRISDRTEIEHTQWAVFAEDEWMIDPDFSLTVGARMDNDENYGSHISPRVYGVWHMDSAWTLKGGVSTGFRSPSLREITSDWGQVSRGGNIYGNPDLEPETSVNQEIGVHFTSATGAVHSGLTVFYNDFKDKITRIQCPVTICTDGPNDFGSDPTYRVNVDEAVTQGVEWSLDADITEAVTLTSSYTYTDSEQKSGEYKGSPLTQLPKHQATAGIDWSATSRLNPWLRVTYRGEESQPTTGPSTNSLIAPSYTYVDTGLSYRVTDNISTRAAVYNLTDKEVTEEEYGYVDDGRRYWLSVNVDF